MSSTATMTNPLQRHDWRCECSRMKLSLILPLLSVPTLISASSGDRRLEFTRCVSQCQFQRCPGDPTRLASSLPLYLTRWTCLDECQYDCMHQITREDQISGTRIHQYYGKWPFWRLGGIQEPASVLFSLFNMWAHVQGAKKILRRVPQQHPMRFYYLTWSLTSINAWIWSSVFHTRGESGDIHLYGTSAHRTRRRFSHREDGLFFCSGSHYVCPILHDDPPIPPLSSCP